MEDMIPQQFKKHRKDLNLTQSQLAKELGLSEKNGWNYIGMIERGVRKPSDSLIKLFELVIEKFNK
jgi:predicted transcriptional regulator